MKNKKQDCPVVQPTEIDLNEIDKAQGGTLSYDPYGGYRSSDWGGSSSSGNGPSTSGGYSGWHN